MACISCNKPESAQSATWGLSARYCDSCFDRALGYVSEKLPGRLEALRADTYLQDYAKILLMMQQMETVRICLRALGMRMARKAAKQEAAGGDPYVKLSAILAKYERMAWFPPSHDVFLGFLKGYNFDNSIAQGIMAKDPGAGVNHGDFTHRLQWHAIISVITNDFTTAKRAGWNHTPLELYTTCGATQYAGKGNVWFRCFDDAGQKDFRSPDFLHLEIRTRPEYGLLRQAVEQRHTKRFQEYKAFDPAPRFKAGSNDQLIVPKAAASDAAGAAYAQRKIGDETQRRIVGARWTPTPFWQGAGRVPGAQRAARPMTLAERIAASRGVLYKAKNVHSPVLGPVPQPGVDDAVGL
jgi:hypothetical protein